MRKTVLYLRQFFGISIIFDYIGGFNVDLGRLFDTIHCDDVGDLINFTSGAWKVQNAVTPVGFHNLIGILVYAR